MNKPPVTVELENVCKHFGGIVALDEVTIRISHPGVVALTGPNGCGKSTLLHVLGGFIRPDRGRCQIDSLDCRRASPEVIAAAGTSKMFQQARVMRSLSVLDNLLLAASTSADESLVSALRFGSAQRDQPEHITHCKALLEELDLRDAEGMPAGLLSYGQQRLLNLGVVLVSNARLLLLDEPSAGLNSRMVARISNLLRLASRHSIIIMAEHDHTLVGRLASRIISMNVGRIINDAPNSAALKAPSPAPDFQE